MEVLKLAVVGTGGRAGAHLATIPKLRDRFRLVSVCDLDPERAGNAGVQHGVPSYTDAVKLLDESKPDVILIATPPEGHHVLVRHAAERGVHAISETPMSFSLACANQMLEDAKQFRTLLEVSENVRRWPLERFKRVVVDSGVLGIVTQIHCWYASGGYHGISAVRNLAVDPARNVIGHGQNVQTGSGYWFDPFLRRSVGEDPRTPTAPPNPAPGSRVATWELGVVTFENGVIAVYQYPIARVRGNHWEVYATEGEIIAGEFYRYEGGSRKPLPVETIFTEVEGVRTIAAIRLTVDGQEVLWENPLRNYPLSDADEIARADGMVSIHRAATEGAELDYGGIGGYRDLEIMIGTRESALRGNAPVSLPIALPISYDRIQHARFEERYGHHPLDFVASSNFQQEARIAAELVR